MRAYSKGSLVNYFCSQSSVETFLQQTIFSGFIYKQYDISKAYTILACYCTF